MIWHNVSDTLFLSSTYSLKNSEHIVTAVSDALGRVAKYSQKLNRKMLERPNICYIFFLWFNILLYIYLVVQGCQI